MASLFFVAVCLCLLSYCFVLTKHGRFSIETTPFFVISMLITVLYVFAYIGFLRMGTLLVLGMGFLLLLYVPILLWKDKDILFQKYFTPGFVLGVFLCIIAVIVAKPIITGWDSFGFWGPYSKLLFINQGFPKAGSIMAASGYPPGGALFHYPFIWLNFDEATILRAQQLLLFAPLLVMVQKVQWKKWYSVVSLFVFGYVIVYFFIKMMLRASLHDWSTLYMDFPVSVFFTSIIIYYQMSKKECSNLWYLLPCIFAFMLLKPQFLSLGLVFFIFIFISVDQLLIRRDSLKVVQTPKLYSRINHRRLAGVRLARERFFPFLGKNRLAQRRKLYWPRPAPSQAFVT